MFACLSKRFGLGALIEITQPVKVCEKAMKLVLDVRACSRLIRRSFLVYIGILYECDMMLKRSWQFCCRLYF